MTEPDFPPIRLELTDGHITAADYTVDSFEDGSPLAQHFVFDRWFDRPDERWFRRMTILHAGKRYFELTVADLIVERN